MAKERVKENTTLLFHFLDVLAGKKQNRQKNIRKHCALFIVNYEGYDFGGKFSDVLSEKNQSYKTQASIVFLKYGDYDLGG